MDAQTWDAWDDPERMLDFLRGKVGDRKYWLFACACCRLLWHRFSDWRIRRVVEAAELFADGRDAGEQLAEARSAVRVAGRAGVAAFAHLLDDRQSGYAAACRCIDGVYCLMAGQPIRRHLIPSRIPEIWDPLREKLLLLVRCIFGSNSR